VDVAVQKTRALLSCFVLGNANYDGEREKETLLMLKVSNNGHGERTVPGPFEMERRAVMVEKSPNSAKDQFLQKLRANSGYIRLTRIPGFDTGRRQRFEESCWRHHCAALRHEFKGARAKRALERLSAFRVALGDPSWIPEEAVSSLDSIQGELQHLAIRGRRGRPKDIVARALRRNIHIFVPPATLFQNTDRSVSREEIDEILGELLEAVCGRKVSAASITRMRMRERSREQKEAGSSSGCYRAFGESHIYYCQFPFHLMEASLEGLF